MFKRWLGLAVMWIARWEFVGEKPEESYYVVIAAPHTSNWDLLYLLASVYSVNLDIKWMGKHTLFRGPMGPIMKALGGVPIVRHKNTNVVDKAAELFDDPNGFVLVVPAEGTRGYMPHWKSGFYHIARKADVPVCLSFVDFSRRQSGMGPLIRMTGDITKDMDKVRAFYVDKVGAYPEMQGEIKLREEMSAEQPETRAS